MKKIHSVLIVDDHIAIIEGFKNALNFITANSKTKKFNIDSAQNCKIAYNKIKDYAQLQNLDLAILDLSLPPEPKLNLNSGDDLGLLIRELLPNTKLLVCTSFTNSFRLRQTLEAYNPLGFINKQDLGLKGFVLAINNVLDNKLHYSQTIISAINKKVRHHVDLDEYDILILKELTNGSKTKDLIQLIPLGKSAIDKRKRLLKRKFCIDTNSDRDLILAAREAGII